MSPKREKTGAAPGAQAGRAGAGDARADRPRRTWLAAAILLAFVLVIFGDVLFAAGDKVVSESHCDICLQYAPWRDFGFSQLRHGNFALWNPHIFSGAPFFGGAQTGLLYPLNFPYLFLPLARAINVGVALHVFLGGLFMYLWASGTAAVPGLPVLRRAVDVLRAALLPHHGRAPDRPDLDRVDPAAVPDAGRAL